MKIMNILKKIFGITDLDHTVKNIPTVNVSDDFDSGNSKLLLLKVSGEYKIGSKGNIDASYICTFADACIQKYCPRSIIVDLSDLFYEWGDEMDYVLDIGNTFDEKPINTAFIIGPHCKTAIGTLIHGVNSSEPATTRENIFESIEDAKNWLSDENCHDKN
jgi:hypothetical protein